MKFSDSALCLKVRNEPAIKESDTNSVAKNIRKRRKYNDFLNRVHLICICRANIELVSHAPDSLYLPAVLVAALKLFADALYMHINGS